MKYSLYREFTKSTRIFILAALISSCSAMDPQAKDTRPVSHAILDSLLKKHVSSDGLVDYASWAKDRDRLQQYLELLVTNPPNDQAWNRNDKLAYWINLYNAFTIDLILEYYPIKSIKDIGSNIQIPFVNTPWDIKLIEINGKKYDLNNVEHNILRKIFDEPRIHFAINCASISCPRLRREAYTGERLERQLQEQTVEFLTDPSRNEISSDKAEISKIFQWFGGDFKKESTLAQFLDTYVPAALSEQTDISFKDYDWSLNEAR